MATLPATTSVRALTVGLALVTVALVGPASMESATASAAPVVAAVEEPGPSPTPDPVPDLGRMDPGQVNQTPPVHHRRHRGDPVR